MSNLVHRLTDVIGTAANTTPGDYWCSDAMARDAAHAVLNEWPNLGANMAEDASPLLTSLRKQREGYMKDLQATALNQQRLQGAIAALDRAIEGATPETKDAAA